MAPQCWGIAQCPTACRPLPAYKEGRNPRLPSFCKPRCETACRLLLTGGIEALKRSAGSNGWVQVGLECGPTGAKAGLYALVAALVRRLLDAGAIRNFFFMHKPLGLRLRFEAGEADAAWLHAQVKAALTHWRREGWITGFAPGIYEPETHLFGGPHAMRFVHQAFTADALAWLDYHALAPSAPGTPAAAPAWAVSLLLLRTLFSGLQITDWEDIDVWDRVVRRAGRRLPAAARSQADVAAAVAQIRTFWLQPDLLWSELSAPVQAIVERNRTAVGAVTQRWWSDYFTAADAAIGPRAAAALLTIFHWNRAGLPPLRQALLAEALAERETV
jgi:thiopeptide-type bacteriocin biosynthesis protein